LKLFEGKWVIAKKNSFALNQKEKERTGPNTIKKTKENRTRNPATRLHSRAADTEVSDQKGETISGMVFLNKYQRDVQIAQVTARQFGRSIGVFVRNERWISGMSRSLVS
jgi:hypothetical protein